MLIVVLLDETYNVDFNDNMLTEFLYRGFAFLYMWFIPHILTIIGLIGWTTSILKNNNS